MKPTTRAPLLTALLVLASGCAAPVGEYPSLAVRDVERVSGTIAVPDAAPLPSPAAATLGQVGPLADQARNAHTAFLAAASTARAQVQSASGAAVGSERWSVAQVVLAKLGAERTQTMIALADVDRLFVDAATAGESTLAIEPVRDEIAALVAEQDAVLESLAGGLAR